MVVGNFLEVVESDDACIQRGLSDGPCNAPKEKKEQGSNQMMAGAQM